MPGSEKKRLRDRERMQRKRMEQAELVAEMVKWLEFLPKPYAEDIKMVQDLIVRVRGRKWN